MSSVPSRLRAVASLLCLWVSTSVAVSEPVEGRIDARMMRQADVSKTQITFVYAGDIWVAPKEGGTGVRLSSPAGEESFPRFSPDGATIAFSGNYDGNLDIYTVPATGGVPERLTHHGAADRMLDWYPDGESILFASGMTSERNRFNQLFRVSRHGGLPEKLPVPYGEFGSISPDGRSLAYTPISRDFRTWKRYRGGMAPDIWLFDLEQTAARNLTQDDANDAQPMWHGNTIYFLSDRGPNQRANIWALNLESGAVRQITRFTDLDIHFPSMGPDELVFECGGRLYLLDLEAEQSREIEIRIVTDRATLKPRTENASGLIRNARLSPTGKRAVFEARGDVFTVPAEHGVVRNLTRSPGACERSPVWSPDGKNIAYFSDRSGEYELTLRTPTGDGSEETVTSLGPGFRYPPVWSPDSRKLVFIDQAMKIHLHDREAAETRQIDQMLWQYHGGLSGFHFAWSSDSRWLTYAGDLDNRQTAIVLYDTQSRQRHPVTSGYYEDDLPVFDPGGKYLFFRSGRSFDPLSSDLDNSWIYTNTKQVVSVPLRKDVPSPLAPRNDEEPTEKKAKDDKKDADADPESEEKSDSPNNESDEASADSSKDKPAKDKAEPKPVEIDLEDFESRAVVLSAKAGRYADLRAVPGKLVYRRLPNAGSGDSKPALLFYDLEKREEKTIIDDVDLIDLSADRKKLLVRRGSAYHIIEPKEGQKLDKRLATATLELTVDPVAEWRQIFSEVWRFQRDYFYDPNLHQVNWPEMRERYGRLLEDAVTRWDVNFVIGELIAELSASHTYRSGGDTESAARRGVGYLGVDFTLEQGAYRIAKILEAGPWDLEVRSPLREPAVEVREGDYLLAVNGVPIAITQDPWAAFQGLADQPVFLTVNREPTREGAREVLVQTLSDESRLRYLAWIEANRRRVEAATEGAVGYVYVPDTGRGGQTELVRQFRAQTTKAGLIIDERFNSGGQIPDRFIELLNRPLYNYWGVRDGRDWPWPPVAHFGPKVMLINGWSGSGGDCFPYYFKQAKLGPLIGTRTWGGLIGITGAPALIDGGSVTVPTFGIYDPDGEWIIEGYGVDPDIEIVDDPAAMARGQDPQLERAIREVMRALRRQPPQKPLKPEYPDRAP